MLAGLALLVVPQIVFAAWWNPLSWFNGWKFSAPEPDKTQVLENRIKELEKKLGTVATSTATTTNQVVSSTQTSELPQPQKKTNTVAPQQTAPVIPSTVKSVNPTPVSPTPTQPARDYKVLYDDLVAKYAFLRDTKLESEITTTKESGTQDTNQSIHVGYLTKLQKSLDVDMAGVTERDPNKYDFWNSKYNQIVKDYDTENERYVKTLVINFMTNNKYYLYQPDMHIKTARTLDLFDRAFGTSYVKEFRVLKTQQETVEFTDSFLLDMGKY